MAKVSKKDLEESIHRPQSDKVKTRNNVVKLTNEALKFDKKGNEAEVLPEDQIMATKNTTDDGCLYTVRVNRKRDLYNPYDSAYASESYRVGTIQNLAPFQMLKVSKECFESYVKFLRYGANQDLIVAQRAL